MDIVLSEIHRYEQDSATMYLYQKYQLELKTHIFILWVDRLPTRTKYSNETFSFFLTVRIFFFFYSFIGLPIKNTLIYVFLKVYCAALGNILYSEEKRLHLLYFLCLNKVNNQAQLQGQHSFIQFNFVYYWRTLPPFQLRILIFL